MSAAATPPFRPSLRTFGGMVDGRCAQPDTAKLAMVRICTHYFSRHAWLDDGQLLRDVHHLSGIRGVLIHGRLDLSAPLLTAWELAQAWPGAELHIIEDSGHTGSPAMAAAIQDAIATFTPGHPTRRSPGGHATGPSVAGPTSSTGP